MRLRNLLVLAALAAPPGCFAEVPSDPDDDSSKIDGDSAVADSVDSQVAFDSRSTDSSDSSDNSDAMGGADGDVQLTPDGLSVAHVVVGPSVVQGRAGRYTVRLSVGQAVGVVAPRIVLSD